MLNGLANFIDQVCVFVVATGKALLPGFCAPLVDLYGNCVYSFTDMLRGAGANWKGVAVAGAISAGGLVASGYVGVGPQQQQPWLLGNPAAAGTTTQTGTTPVQSVTSTLPGWQA